MSHDKVRTLRRVVSRVGVIPAGWEGEEQYQATGIDGEKLIFIEFTQIGEIVALKKEEIEYVREVS